MPSQVQALVVGAGISGLATAFALQKSGILTLTVDSAARPGGVIHSVKRDGYLLECGPQSFSGNSSIASVSSELGLLSERLLADPKAPRYVLIDGRLQAVSLGPGLLVSPLLSGGTRFALFRDIFGNSTPPEPDESVAAFVRRKFSPLLLDRLVGPFVSGIYAGDAEELSLRAAFPILYEAEKGSASVVRGAIKIMKSRKETAGDAPREKPTLQTFQDGNESLIQALAERLGNSLYCSVEVASIQPLDPGREPAAPRFRATLRTPRGEEAIEAERLILAVPTDVAGKLLASLHAEFESPFCGMEYAGIAVVSLGYRKDNVARPLDGFGFLVPRSSGLAVLGTVWNSSLFPGRAPDGQALVTSFVGGASNPGAVKQSPEDLVAQVHRELTPILGIAKEPVFRNVTIWPRAIPQYNLGHTARLAAIEKLRANFPGLYIVGNYLKGPAIGTCIEHALKAANEIRVSFAN
jgi:protoporphyrinogen/coproporphyrinogen III oxidase